MPFYDLRCVVCDKEFNIMASISDKTEHRIACPECGSTGMSTVFKSAPYYNKGAGEEVPACPNSRSCGTSCPHAQRV